MENKRFQCKICNYRSNRKDNFDRHMKSKKHTKNVSNQQTNSTPRQNSEESLKIRFQNWMSK